jgi:hypothetical protein
MYYIILIIKRPYKQRESYEIEKLMLKTIILS